MNMKTTLLGVLVLGLVLLGPAVESRGDPLGTAFTYQGQLKEAGSPADGPYDFAFLLYDDSEFGDQVGETFLVEDADVLAGLFTVRIDFGDVFDGTALWLEIRVRPGDSGGSYTPLWPRQEVTPAPYVIYATNADKVDDYHAGNSSGQVAVSNGTKCSNLNADKLDGYHAGNSSGRVAVSNGTLCTNLNADKVDGYDGGDFPLCTHFSLGGGGGTIYVDIPHYRAFQLVVTECHMTPDNDAVGFVYCIVNDGWIAWQGFNGIGLHVRGRADLDSTEIILTVDAGRIVVRAPGDGSHRLRIVSDDRDMQGMLIRP